MRDLLRQLNLQGDIPAEKPKGVMKKSERMGQFFRCMCGHCRCTVSF